MLIQETFIDKSGGYIIGENAPYEPWTDEIGALFNALQQEHGRCTGKAYVDLKSGGYRQTGWVFEKRVKYTDCNDTYLQEVWVSVFNLYEEKTVIECERYNFEEG